MGTPAADQYVFLSSGWLVGALACCVVVLGVALVLALTRGRSGLQSRLRDASSQLCELRSRDPVTGLLNRVEFDTELDAAVLSSDRQGTPLAVVVVGLDNFRPINEGYGHRVGDALLSEAGHRLQACGGPALLACARLGGDEFALLLRGGAEQGGAVAAAVVQALQQPFRAEDALSLHVSASVGMAAYPEHGSRPRLLNHASLAMHSVKDVGGAGHASYDPAMAVDQREQAELLQDLRRAIERRELQLVYQPKVDARTLQITAAEALLRWQHPRRGTLSPALFVPLAERHGLIAPIGRWVIEEACRQAAEWRGCGLRMRVAVNVSGHQLRQDDMVDHLEGALKQHAIPAGRLTLEITETVAMEDTGTTRRAFERLRKAGLHVSIDDFGTGHSSLAALRRLPAAELKIDRAFVTDLASGEHARGIVQAIVQMARTLGLRVVAEGVETEAQRDALVALGCDELQGFLFARPMSATALGLWADDDGGSDGRGSDAPAFRPSLFEPTAPLPLGW